RDVLAAETERGVSARFGARIGVGLPAEQRRVEGLGALQIRRRHVAPDRGAGRKSVSLAHESPSSVCGASDATEAPWCWAVPPRRQRRGRYLELGDIPGLNLLGLDVLS